MTRSHFRCFALVAIFVGLLFAAGCRNYESFWINVTVVNQTGAAIKDIEVDYPSASFGINLLPAGAVYHYRLKVNGHGKLSAQYLAPMDKPVKVSGPSVQDNQQGQVTITLLPQGKITFADQLTMGHSAF